MSNERWPWRLWWRAWTRPILVAALAMLAPVAVATAGVGEVGGPMLAGTNIHYEIADTTRGVDVGGIGAIHLLTHSWSCRRRSNVLKRHVPYFDSRSHLRAARPPLPRDRDRFVDVAIRGQNYPARATALLDLVGSFCKHPLRCGS